MLFPTVKYDEGDDRLELIITPGNRGQTITSLVFYGLVFIGLIVLLFWVKSYNGIEEETLAFWVVLLTTLYAFVFVFLARVSLTREIIVVDRKTITITTRNVFGQKKRSSYNRSGVFNFKQEGYLEEGALYFTYDRDKINFARSLHPEDAMEAWQAVMSFFNRCQEEVDGGEIIETYPEEVGDSDEDYIHL
jgi:hypothetical protein